MGYNYDLNDSLKKVIPANKFIGSTDNYYFIKVKCSNCGFEDKVYVEKRLPLFFAYCPDCQCQRGLCFLEKCKIERWKKI